MPARNSPARLEYTGSGMHENVPCELQWQLRDSSCLTRLDLHGGAAAEFLGMSHKIPRLEYLGLKGVLYTYESAERLLCLLQSMRSLKELYLDEFKPERNGKTVLEHTSVRDACRLQAGLSLRKAVSRLPELTSLILNYVHVMDPGHGFRILHPWTQLKKLIIKDDSPYGDHECININAVGLEAMTSLTELHMTVPFAHKPIDVQNLAHLQRLHLDYKPDSWNDPGTTYHPFLFPEAATITKLHMVITDKGGKDLADILPLHSLKDIKELNMEHQYFDPSLLGCSWEQNQQWPMAWSRLVALTSLSCKLCYLDYPYIPMVLNYMSNLRELEILHYFHTEEMYDSDKEDECMVTPVTLGDKLSRNLWGLTQLDSLVTDVDESLWRFG